MLFNTNKEKGNAGFALAIGYFGSNGYTVSLPLNDTQNYDLIVDSKEFGLQKVQVKATGQRTDKGLSIVALTSKGGTKGTVYSRVVETEIDILFVVTELSEMYLIPKEDIDVRSAMTLTPERQQYRVDSVNTVYKKEEKENNKIKYCLDCGEIINYRSDRCVKCAAVESGLNKRLVERPTPEVLELELRESNFSAVGRKYGVSDNAIRKWCKAYGMSTKSSDYKG